MDIERLKDKYTLGFRKGDIIQISEKFDGSNASIRYDNESSKLIAFSRKKMLDFQNTLNGFYNFVQELNADDYKDTPNYVIFGEWATKNAIVYYPESMKKWYVYDIYDTEKEIYLTQMEVKQFAEKHNLTYIHVFYEGNWEHVQSFVGKSIYGEHGEGIVIKNQTRLNDPDNRMPFVVKIVGEKFQEVQKCNHVRKLQDPQKLQEREIAIELVESIVTKRRVEKELYKMRDEGILPEDWCEKDMKTVARELPRRIYNDCIKEEEDIVRQTGEYFGKFCSSVSMKYAKEIIICRDRI